MSTMRRQSSRIAAFLQADAGPMFCWPRSASTARSQVWLGLPNGRFQSGGSLRITAATARWWSSCGELRAICPNSRKRLSLTRWVKSTKHTPAASCVEKALALCVTCKWIVDAVDEMFATCTSCTRLPYRHERYGMALAIDHKLSFNGMTIDHATSAHVRRER